MQPTDRELIQEFLSHFTEVFDEVRGHTEAISKDGIIAPCMSRLTWTINYGPAW